MTMGVAVAVVALYSGFFFKSSFVTHGPVTEKNEKNKEQRKDAPSLSLLLSL